MKNSQLPQYTLWYMTVFSFGPFWKALFFSDDHLDLSGGFQPLRSEPTTLTPTKWMYLKTDTLISVQLPDRNKGQICFKNVFINTFPFVKNRIYIYIKKWFYSKHSGFCFRKQKQIATCTMWKMTVLPLQSLDQVSIKEKMFSFSYQKNNVCRKFNINTGLPLH